jgi:plastocyanin
MKKILTGVALLVLAVAVGAPAAADGPASTSQAQTVEIVNFAFRPATVEIGKGQRVVFANTASVAHTATRGGAFDTKRIKPGRSAGVRFKQTGTFRYHCKIHPEMRGRVVVG